MSHLRKSLPVSETKPATLKTRPKDENDPTRSTEVSTWTETESVEEGGVWYDDTYTYTETIVYVNSIVESCTLFKARTGRNPQTGAA